MSTKKLLILGFLMYSTLGVGQDLGYALIKEYANSHFEISSISITKDATIINCITHIHTYGSIAEISPPNTKEAPFLRANGQRFEFVGAENIAYTPNQTILDPSMGKEYYFSLSFEPIPKNVTIFDLIEPMGEFGNSFTTYDIKMSRKKKIKASMWYKNEDDFNVHFEQDSLKSHEGFWQIQSYYVIKDNPEKIFVKNEKVAIVYEDDRFRLYHLNGYEFGMTFKIEEKQKAIFQQKTTNYEYIESSTLFTSSNNFKFSRAYTKKESKKIFQKNMKDKVTGYFELTRTE